MKKLMNPMMGVSLLLTLFGADAFAGVEKVALCKFCNSSAFRNAAEVTALSEVPKLEEGSQYVFVFDVGTEEIRYYEVVREYIQTCLQNGQATTSSLTGPILDPDLPPPPDCFSSWVTSSTQLTPPASTVVELRAEREEIDKFIAEIQDVDLEELNLGIVTIRSATDLIGPRSDSHNPEFLRGNLQNALSNKFTDTLLNRAILEAGNLLSQFWTKVVSDPGGITSITVNFPDGTKIEVEVIDRVKDENGNIKGLKLKVDVTSAALDDVFAQLPVDPTDFINPFQNGFEGDSRLIENLGDLFVRGGGRLTRNRSGGGCRSTIVCIVDIDTETGETGPRCETNEPEDQLRSC